jgi:hypothetical protein
LAVTLDWKMVQNMAEKKAQSKVGKTVALKAAA